MAAEASDGERRLYADLFVNASYNSKLRPRRDPTEAVVVDVELDLNHLINLVRHISVNSALAEFIRDYSHHVSR